MLRTDPAALYLLGLGRGSRDTMARAVATCSRLLFVDGWQPGAWGGVRQDGMLALRAELAERYAPATANRMLAAVRGVLRQAWALGLMASEDYRRAVDVPKVAGSRGIAGREVTGRELAALFRSCKGDGARGARDAALLALLYGCGLRRGEAAAIELADVDMGGKRTPFAPRHISRIEGNEITINRAESAAVTVRGKGDKARTAYATGGALAALHAWCAVRGGAPGPLVCCVWRGGHVRVRGRLSTKAVNDIIRRRAELAGVASFSPHDLRRSFAGDMLDAGADLATVQQLMGHASPATTSRYDRRGERTRQRAAGLLRVPYQEG